MNGCAEPEDAAMKTERKPNLGRRQFFRGVGVGLVATAAAPIATEALADSESDDEKRKARYRESDEVKTYYRVNRYPS
jgi:hypothetical protein